MKLNIITALLFTSYLSVAQESYSIRNSAEFDDLKGLPLSQTNVLENGNTLLTYAKGDKLENIGLMLFDNELKIVNSKTHKLLPLFTNKKVNFERLLTLKNKTYIFAREAFKETKTEGISVVELSSNSLETTTAPTKLFESSRGVIGGSYGYGVSKSNDNTKFLYKYTLFNREKKDALNKIEYGFHVFDENLNKLWGGEFQMPYTEAKMNTIDYQLSNDGKLYFLIKVIDIPGKDELSHFEMLVYENNKKEPKIIELKLDEYIHKSTYLYEDKKNNIVITGFYSKKGNPSIDGAYLVKINTDNGQFSKVGGGYYEIPTEIIKSYMSDRQKEKLDKKEEKNAGNDKKDIGINNLGIDKIYFLDDGSTIIVSEIYFVITRTHYNGKTTTTTYDTYAQDLFIFKINPIGNLAWIKKIPKRQHSADASGEGLSIASTIKDNHLHVFYIDHLDNFNLPENEAPKTHQNKRGGYLAAIEINESGMINKVNLGPANQFETNFYIRKFKTGKQNNLIAVERKKKKNMLFSIDMK